MIEKILLIKINRELKLTYTRTMFSLSIITSWQKIKPFDYDIELRENI